MPEACSCGAELPDNARFCHRCGKPQREQDLPAAPAPASAPAAIESAARPAIHFGNPVALRVALLCASLSALLNSIPFVSFGCCLWITGAGFLAVFLYSRRTGLLLSSREGVRLGWITGLLTFVLTILLTAVNFALARGAAGGFREAVRQSVEKMPARDAVTQQMIDFLLSPAGLVLFLLTFLVVEFVAMISLAIAGGAMGAKVMEKD